VTTSLEVEGGRGGDRPAMTQGGPIVSGVDGGCGRRQRRTTSVNPLTVTMEHSCSPAYAGKLSIVNVAGVLHLPIWYFARLE
jgi:hypothetical protein